jgi:hypothetical protein
VLKNFMEHWKAMKEKKSEPVGNPSKVNQGSGGPQVARAIRSRLGRGVWCP